MSRRAVEMFLRRKQRVEESGPFWKQRSWQLSAGFLGVVVVLSIVAALTSATDDTGDRARAAASVGPLSGATVMKNGRPEGCDTDDSAGDTVPKAAPKNVSWRKLGVARVPVSSSAGPTRTEGVPWWCFAHTPIGAVLAAHIIPSQMSGPHWRTATEQQVVSGTGRDMFEFKRSVSQDVDPETSGVSVATFAGYSVTSYTSKAATVRLLLRGEQGYAATSIVLRWSGGDWKIQPTGNGSLHSSASSVTSAAGFTLWGG
ncbi:hypothetical protein ACFVT5_19325 [Streptomyces sp. NPDC058001]|uniref:hypothetical protein n=1 Tax=Streptomyces sp. NPDC058001 TaxID=3346300 RepID=UPI0036F07FAC